MPTRGRKLTRQTQKAKSSTPATQTQPPHQPPPYACVSPKRSPREQTKKPASLILAEGEGCCSPPATHSPHFLSYELSRGKELPRALDSRTQESVCVLPHSWERMSQSASLPPRLYGPRDLFIYLFMYLLGGEEGQGFFDSLPLLPERWN